MKNITQENTEEREETTFGNTRGRNVRDWGQNNAREWGPPRTKMTGTNQKPPSTTLRGKGKIKKGKRRGRSLKRKKPNMLEQGAKLRRKDQKRTLPLWCRRGVVRERGNDAREEDFKFPTRGGGEVFVKKRRT